MVRVRVRKTFLKATQLGEFEAGQVKAHLHHNLGPAAIAKIMAKPDGKSRYSENAISDCIKKIKADPNWRGGRKQGSGRPRKTTEAQDRALVAMLIKTRGQKRVTVAFLRTCFRWTQGLGDTLLEERLHEAGLVYLRRVRKTLVAPSHLEARVRYCHLVVRMHQSTLDKWAYSDGTVFYLDRTELENVDRRRAALGSYVWRRADRLDALYSDCVGPSCYRKAQGEPVRVWGLLAAGKLNIRVLEKGEVMDRYLYQEIVEDNFPNWLAGCEYLVQDFERCLRCDEAMEALKDIGVKLVQDYPPVSQDFNAIENAWAMLKDRVNETMPVGVEGRDRFTARLGEAVKWVNRNNAEELETLSRNQKRRARDCLESVPPGSRTKW